jgi:hypothetical protein
MASEEQKQRARELGVAFSADISGDALDLLIAACFEMVEVFNPITADHTSRDRPITNGVVVAAKPSKSRTATTEASRTQTRARIPAR